MTATAKRVSTIISNIDDRVVSAYEDLGKAVGAVIVIAVGESDRSRFAECPKQCNQRQKNTKFKGNDLIGNLLDGAGREKVTR